MKESEYKYRITVSRARKINLGNYESTDIFGSMSQGFDNKKEEEEVRQYLISEVSKSIDGQVELMTGFQKASSLEPEHQHDDANAEPKSTIVFVEGTKPPESKDDYPPTVPCRQCGKTLRGSESKHKPGTKYYKCKDCDCYSYPGRG